MMMPGAEAMAGLMTALEQDNIDPGGIGHINAGA
jgi:hypothetical protein